MRQLNNLPESLKILFVSDVYFPRINGVSTSIRTFAAELQQMGHTVHLIAPDYGIATEDEAWIKRIPSRKIFFDPEDRLMKYGSALDILPELELEKYDIVHIHTPFVAHYLGLKLAQLLKVPCVETYHTFFEDYLHLYLPIFPKSVARVIARMISRRQCNALDAVIAPSQPMMDALRTYGVVTDIQVIPTGLQTYSFAKANQLNFRNRHGIAETRQMLLYLGRVAHEKNIEFLLHMLVELRQKIPDVLLVVAGEGPAEGKLHALADSLALADNIKFVGYLDRKTELNDCYSAADVFVFSSKSETQGLVLLEAMAQATPVVAIAEMGTKSILIEGEGALVATEDTQVFAEKVYYLLSNPKKLDSLGKRAREYAQKHWTSKVQAERLLAMHQRLVS